MSSARSLRRRTARRVAATRSAPESSRARHAAPGVDARDRTRGRRTTGTRQARQGSRRSRSAARRGDRRARHADRRGRAAGHSGHRDQRRSARQRTPNYGETRRGPRDGTAVGATDPRGPRPLPADHHPARLTPTGCPKSPKSRRPQIQVAQTSTSRSPRPPFAPPIPPTPNPGVTNDHLARPEATVRATHSGDPKSRWRKRPPRTPRAHRSRHPFPRRGGGAAATGAAVRRRGRAPRGGRRARPASGEAPRCRKRPW